MWIFLLKLWIHVWLSHACNACVITTERIGLWAPLVTCKNLSGTKRNTSWTSHLVLVTIFDRPFNLNKCKIS